MNKSQLIAAVAERTGEGAVSVAAILDGITATIQAAVSDEDTVEIKDFGKFEQTHRPARNGRNPQTGESMRIDESWGVKFSPYGALKTAVRGRAQSRMAPRSAAA